MFTGLWHTHDSNFGSLSWFWRRKEHPCPLSPHLGLWRKLEVPDWNFSSWSSIHPMFQNLALNLDCEGAKTINVLSIPIWALGLASWSWFGYGDCFLLQLYFKFWLSIWILKMQRTSMSFKSSFWAFEDARGSWLGFGILILLMIWSLVFDTPMFWMFSF